MNIDLGQESGHLARRVFCTVRDMPDPKRAEEYKRLALKARRDAENVLDPQIRRGFLKVAEEYERMAEAALK